MLYLNERLTNYFRHYIVLTSNRRWQILMCLLGCCRTRAALLLCFSSSFEVCECPGRMLLCQLPFSFYSSPIDLESIGASLGLTLKFSIPPHQ